MLHEVFHFTPAISDPQIADEDPQMPDQTVYGPWQAIDLAKREDAMSTILVSDCYCMSAEAIFGMEVFHIPNSPQPSPGEPDKVPGLNLEPAVPKPLGWIAPQDPDNETLTITEYDWDPTANLSAGQLDGKGWYKASASQVELNPDDYAPIPVNSTSGSQ